MTTITYPSGNTTTFVIGAVVGALAMLILAAAMAFAALGAPVITNGPEAGPAPMTNQANSDDPTPNSGVLEFAD